MHSQFPDHFTLALESRNRDIQLPCSPHLKPPPAADGTSTPRLRTSISSHSRLLPDDFCSHGRSISAISIDSLLDGAFPKAEGRRGVSGLMDLPEEIQQRILDMLMGELGSITSNSVDRNHALRNWNHAMRHPRGRNLANLALVTPLWRRLIQERIYRHIKIQGTKDGLEECFNWFASYPHLQVYVRHVEFWVPVWERRGGTRDLRDPASSTPMDVAVQFHDRLNFTFAMESSSTTVEPLSSAYRLSSQKATLDELFFCVATIFPSACVLTIEGGHCKKPPMIEHFRTPGSTLISLPAIRILVMRGSWNIMRENQHFQTISSALPSVKEFHCSFTKPKSKVYLMMHSIIRQMPPTLTHLNLCLEGFYSKKTISVVKMQVLQRENHLCDVVGRLLPQLEALTLTGRACSHIFIHAIEAAAKYREPRLKSLDLVVKNCCRGLDVWNDGTGIHNWSFIAAFEQLVTTATRALKSYSDLNFLRIRFVDLDAPAPLLNPYFQLQGEELTGIWNETILKNLEASRPKARYADFSDSLGMVNKAFPGYPSHRPRSMRTSIYQAFIDGGSFF